MFFSISRLGLAAATPALVFGQQLSTYYLTFSGVAHSIVLPAPPSVTVYVTRAAETVTAMSVETRTFTVTGPAAEISNLKSNFPESVGLVPSEKPGPIVPVEIHGYTASVQLPASVSVPSGPVTIPPAKAVVPTPAKPSPTGNAAESAAHEESAVASNVAGSQPATSPETASPKETQAAGSGTAKGAESTAGAAVVAGKPSEAGSAASSKASALASSAREEASATAKALSSEAARSATEEASTKATGERTATESVPTSILIDTSSAPAPASSTTVTETTEAAATASSETQTPPPPSSSTSTGGESNSSSSPPPPESSSATSPPQRSSTSAPSSGAEKTASLPRLYGVGLLTLVAGAGIAAAGLVV